MCLIQKMVFKLKKGFTEPHRVEVSFNKSGNYAKVMVGDSRRQKIELFPCSGREARCADCLEIHEKKPDSLEKIFVSLMKFEEIFVENYQTKEVAKAG